jgi:hypothetical protein
MADHPDHEGFGRLAVLAIAVAIIGSLLLGGFFLG